MKSYTDLEQSKKLTEILPIESADMYYEWPNKKVHFKDDKYSGMGFSCWSLVSLLGVLPVIIGNVLSENALRLRIDKSETSFNVWYENLDTDMVEEGLDIIESNLVDACVTMIEKLHELNLL